MGILDGIVEWIAEQVMYGLDLKCCTAAACKYAVEESAGNGPVGGAKWKSEMCCLLLAPLQNSRRNTICPKKHPKDMIHA